MNLKSLNVIFHLLNFYRSTAVGSSFQKARIRFLDLSQILTIHEDHLNVVELGAGSSTLFFLSQNKVSSLATLEECEKYLPKIKSSKLRTHLLVVIEDNIKGRKGTRYQGSEPFIQTANFIYIDGPTTGNDQNGFAQPNLDIFVSGVLSDKTIAIDGRSNTVWLAIEHLSQSHYFIPSRAYLRHMGKFNHGLTVAFGQIEKKYFKKLEGKLVRTSVFLPKNQFTSKSIL
jgi:hypothetical protein